MWLAGWLAGLDCSVVRWWLVRCGAVVRYGMVQCGWSYRYRIAADDEHNMLFVGSLVNQISQWSHLGSFAKYMLTDERRSRFVSKLSTTSQQRAICQQVRRSKRASKRKTSDNDQRPPPDATRGGISNISINEPIHSSACACSLPYIRALYLSFELQ